jgi:restriction system protein
MAMFSRNFRADGFPNRFRVAYSSASKELVVDRELPRVEVVPAIAEFRYVKVRDSIDSKPRKQSDIRILYQDIVASVALRTLHEVFNVRNNDQVQVVTFSGYFDR